MFLYIVVVRGLEGLGGVGQERDSLSPSFSPSLLDLSHAKPQETVAVHSSPPFLVCACSRDTARVPFFAFCSTHCARGSHCSCNYNLVADVQEKKSFSSPSLLFCTCSCGRRERPYYPVYKTKCQGIFEHSPQRRAIPISQGVYFSL